MQDIIESIINGQRIQALQLLKESNYDIVDLVTELKELEMYNEIVTILKIALNKNYLIENKEEEA